MPYNMTLSTLSLNSFVTLELWTEELAQPLSNQVNNNPNTIQNQNATNLGPIGKDYTNYRLNGNLYIQNMDLFQQNPGVGKTSYQIDIGLHD